MADKFFTTRKFFQYYLPITLTLFTFVTIERTVITDGGNDRLYGLPLPYITSSYGYSFRYDVFILPMLFNLAAFFILTISICKLIEKVGLKLKTHWLFLIVGTLVSLFWATMFVLTVQDSSFFVVDKSDYKTTSRTLVFSPRP